MKILRLISLKFTNKLSLTFLFLLFLAPEVQVRERPSSSVLAAENNSHAFDPDTVYIYMKWFVESSGIEFFNEVLSVSEHMLLANGGRAASSDTFKRIQLANVLDAIFKSMYDRDIIPKKLDYYHVSALRSEQRFSYAEGSRFYSPDWFEGHVRIQLREKDSNNNPGKMYDYIIAPLRELLLPRQIQNIAEKLFEVSEENPVMIHLDVIQKTGFFHFYYQLLELGIQMEWVRDVGFHFPPDVIRFRANFTKTEQVYFLKHALYTRPGLFTDIPFTLVSN